MTSIEPEINSQVKQKYGGVNHSLKFCLLIDVCLCHTHDNDVGHALEGGLLDLADLVLVDAQLLQALGHVGRHVLEHVLRQVEALQLGQRGESLRVDHADLVVDQDQSLKRKKIKVDKGLLNLF